MVGVNPVTTYNPALYPQQQVQQQPMAMGQQPIMQPQQMMPVAQATASTTGMTDLQKELANVNALGVEGTTQVLPQILAMSQQTAQIKEATKANNELKQKNIQLEAQIQANALKGQQQGVVQGQALQQLQATMPQLQPQQPTATVGVAPSVVPTTMPTIASTPATNNFENQKMAAITSGNLGELAKVTASEVTSDAPRILKLMEEEKLKTTYRNGLMAQGIPKDQATALTNQKYQADNAAATEQVAAPQQPIMVQQPQQQQMVQQQPVDQQPVQVQQPVAQTIARAETPITEEMVDVPGVGKVPKATLAAVLQNTSPEAQQAQLQAQQQQVSQPPPATATTTTPRAVLPQADYTMLQATLPTMPTIAPSVPQQQWMGLPPVASPLAFASVNSYGNSGITANNYQQMLGYINQQQQSNGATPSTTGTASTTEDSYAKAKIEATKLGFDTSTMPNNAAEQTLKRKKRHKKLMAKLLAKPKLYIPKPDDSKYASYGGGEASSST
jgi:hypothetical protein